MPEFDDLSLPEQLDTRDGRLRLIEAGEEMIGWFGPAGVSMRQIVSAAGHANPAAVQYHFGGLDGLIEAIYRHRLPEIEARRAEMLGALDDAGLRDMRALLNIKMQAYFHVPNSKGELAFVRFVSQLGLSEELPARWAESAGKIAPVSIQVIKLIKAAMPPADPTLQSVRIILAFHMLHAAIGYYPEQRVMGMDHTALLDEALDMAAASLMRS
jgi:AcrR family transcriptional regulator